MHRRAIALFVVLFTLLSTAITPAAAQYAIPDCAVARVNEITNSRGSDWFAARDQYYQQLSGEYSVETAGLNATQITAYSQAFCASLVIIDGGIEQTADGEVWNLSWSYIPVSAWLAQSGGSTSSNSGNSGTTSNSGGNGASGTVGTIGGSTGSGISGAGGGASATGGGVSVNSTKGGTVTDGVAPGVTDGATVTLPSSTSPETSAESPVEVPASAEPLFETTFDSMPSVLELLDSDMNTAGSDIVDADGDSFLRIKASDVQILNYTGSSALTDYAVEVDARINSGMLVLTARGSSDFCEGYDFTISPGTDEAFLHYTDGDCNGTVLDASTRPNVAFGDWATLRLEVSGDTLTASVNGQTLLTATDTTLQRGSPMLFIFVDDEAKDDALVDISAFRVLAPGAVSASSLPAAPAARLTQYAGPASQAIAELQSLGVVPAGHGVMIFSEPTAYFEGSGLWYQPLASTAPHTNIVMAGQLEVSFRSETEYESCTMMSRIVTSGTTAVEELDAGIDSEGDVVVFDRSDPNAAEPITMFEYSAVPGGSDATHHFLIVAIEDRFSLYIDGELFFENLEVESRSGSYGVGLVSGSPYSRCEANNLWVYSFD